MGMKDPKQEPQSQLASNLVSGPKQSYDAGSDYAGLVSMAKDTEGAKTVAPNLVSHANDKNPG